MEIKANTIVKIKSWDEMEREYGLCSCGEGEIAVPSGFTQSMEMYCGKYMTIDRVVKSGDDIFYRMKEDKGIWAWDKEMFTVVNDMIINIIGASGSGKTTVTKELEKKGYNIIHSYTNREPRGHDEWGHKFINDDGFTIDTDGLVGQQNGVATNNYGKIIALRELYGNIYFATKEQYLDKGISIYVVDPIGANQVKVNVDSVPVVTIFLNADEKTRKERLLRTRCPKQAMDRIKDDRKIFKTLQCDHVIDANRELKLVVRDIVHIIELEKKIKTNTYFNGGHVK